MRSSSEEGGRVSRRREERRKDERRHMKSRERSDERKRRKKDERRREKKEREEEDVDHDKEELKGRKAEKQEEKERKDDWESGEKRRKLEELKQRIIKKKLKEKEGGEAGKVGVASGGDEIAKEDEGDKEEKWQCKAERKEEKQEERRERKDDGRYHERPDRHRHKDDRHKEDRHDRHKEDRNKEDRNKEDRHYRHKNDRHDRRDRHDKDDRHRREEGHKVESNREDRQRSSRHDKHKQEKYDKRKKEEKRRGRSREVEDRRRGSDGCRQDDNSSDASDASRRRKKRRRDTDSSERKRRKDPKDNRTSQSAATEDAPVTATVPLTLTSTTISPTVPPIATTTITTTISAPSPSRLAFSDAPPGGLGDTAEWLTKYQQGLLQAALLAQTNTSPGIVGVPAVTTQLDPISKHARKVYVGNLPPGVTDINIQMFVNEFLNSKLSNKPLGDPVVGVYLNEARRFAFVEHRSIEEANYTLSQDGIVWIGHSLKLRRPQDYSPQLAEQQLQIEMQGKQGVSSLRGAVGYEPVNVAANIAPNVVSTTVEDGPNKVFVGGLPHIMTDESCKELLQSFGPLKSFHLVKDRERTNECKGYAFCEFVEDRSTTMACEGLNGMKIADRVLNVRRAAPLSAMAKAGVAPALLPLRDETVPITEPPEPIPKPVIPPTPIVPMGNYEAATVSIGKTCRVIAVKNMATSEQMKNAGCRERWMDDVRRQCSAVCEVLSVELQGTNVLVECPATHQAVQIMKILQGKMYDGRLLTVAFSEATSSMKKASILRLMKEAQQVTLETAFEKS
eukprot:GHVS01000235.1.p1 GENE.GHVS01000235.1~~GHVS01000235.1.p1  ORF type:complete len:791 (-),score=190.01 GHVS01000235.1:291-2663(-)